MNREIKFRLYGEDNDGKKRMFESFGLRDEDLGTIADDVEIMQFTGLLDAKGKEIYEGDIVSVVSTNKGQYHVGKKTRVIAWTDTRNALGWNIARGSEEKTRLEVVGNVHENPELLKV